MLRLSLIHISKSNTRRIEKLEQQQKDLNKLVTAVEVLASREKGVETDVKEIKADVKTITQKAESAGMR